MFFLVFLKYVKLEEKIGENLVYIFFFLNFALGK